MVPDNLLLVASLLDRYRSTFRQEHYGGMWRRIFERHHRELHQIFMTGAAVEVAEVLSDPRSNYLCYGYEMFRGSPEVNHHDASALRLLAQALGNARLPNPEEGSPIAELVKRYRTFINEHASADSILERIDRRIDFPNPFAREYGLITSRGIAGHRAIMAIYQAKQLKGRVLEIGGGMGRTAYYASRFGITNYTIVDLPFTAITQGYFLGRSLGNHCVQILSPDEFLRSSETYDLCLNVDSLTELAPTQAKQYAKAVRARCGELLSINHESNAYTVRDLFGQPASRYPYWMRPGYVEERFSFTTR